MGDCQLVAGKRLIGLPIADVQLENPRAVGKGRLLTYSVEKLVFVAATTLPANTHPIDN